MNRMVALNWKRGFLRIWIAITALWAVLWLLLWDPLYDYREMTNARQEFDQADRALRAVNEILDAGEPYKYPNGDTISKAEIEADLAQLDDIHFKRVMNLDRKRSIFTQRLYVFFGAPLTLLFAGIGLAWIVRGFRSSTSTAE